VRISCFTKRTRNWNKICSAEIKSVGIRNTLNCKNKLCFYYGPHTLNSNSLMRRENMLSGWCMLTLPSPTGYIWNTGTRPHGIKINKLLIFIVAALRTLNLTDTIGCNSFQLPAINNLKSLDWKFIWILAQKLYMMTTCLSHANSMWQTRQIL